MKSRIQTALGALALSVAGSSAMATCAGGAEHTIDMFVFGFFPKEQYVCAGDRVRFHNRSGYYTKVEIAGVIPPNNPSSDESYQDYASGDLAPGTYSSWFDVGANSDVSFDPQLTYYDLSSYTTYQGTLIVGSPPNEYAAGERWTDLETN